MRKYVMEFIGTFFLLLVIGLCVISPDAGQLAPLAIGTVLMVMVYAGGHVSGGHYNPAVTLGVWMRGKCDTKDVPYYMIAQVLGGALASLLVIKLKHGGGMPPLFPHKPEMLAAEFIFTFALVFVVLNTATSKKTAGNSYYGLAIGFTLMTAAYSIGSISGCAINPAVAIGVTMMGLSKLANLWIFLLADFAGGALAAVVFKYLNPEEQPNA
ncbi:MAG: MIP/aquaporin family protein [Deltaproteobacteria bacterium]